MSSLQNSFVGQRPTEAKYLRTGKQGLGPRMLEDEDKELDHAPNSVEEMEEEIREFHKEIQERLSFWEHVDREYDSDAVTRSSEDTEVYGLHHVPSNLIYNLVQMVEATSYNRKPKFFFEGANPEDMDRAKVLENATNIEWAGDLELERQMKLCVRECSKRGHSFAVTEYMQRRGDRGRASQMARLRKMKSESPFEAMAVEDQQAEEAELAARGAGKLGQMGYELDERKVEGRVVTRWMDARDVFINVGATDTQDCWLIGRDVWADMGLLNKAERRGAFRNKDFTLSSLWSGQTDQASTLRDFDRYEKMLRRRRPGLLCREAFVRNEMGDWEFVLYAVGAQQELIRKKSPYWFGHPYDLLRWNDSGSGFFAPGDVAGVWKLIQSINMLLTKTIESYARQQDNVTFISSDLGITEQTLKTFTKPGVGTVALVDAQMDKRLADFIVRLPKDQASPEALGLLNLLLQQLQYASGFSANHFGGALKSETSATEARNISNASAARGNHRPGAVARFTRNVAFKRAALMAQYYDKTDMIRSVGPDLGKKWPQDWTPFDIQDRMRLMIEQGSMQPVDDEARFEKLLRTLQLSLQSPGALQTVSLPVLYERLFQAMGFREGDPIVVSTDSEQSAAAVQAAQQSAVTGAAPDGESAPGQAAGMTL